jgi:hypothetical protein
MDWVAGEPGDGDDAVPPTPGGIPVASGALPRFGLDIGRGTSGRADGADAVRGHPRFLREASMPPKRPVMLNIRRRRRLPEAHRTQPPRTPAARSFKVSVREMAGAFPPRSCEATIYEIAHQVKPDGGPRGALEENGVIEKCGWPPAALGSVCRCRQPQGKLRAPRHGRRAGHGVPRGGLATGRCAARGHDEPGKGMPRPPRPPRPPRLRVRSMFFLPPKQNFSIVDGRPLSRRARRECCRHYVQWRQHTCT